MGRSMASPLSDRIDNSTFDLQVTNLVIVKKDFISPHKPVINKHRPYNSIVYALSGDGRFTAGEYRMDIRAGDLHFFRSGILNRSEAINGKDRSYIYINFETNNDDVFNRSPFSPVILLSNRADFEAVFHKILAIWESGCIGYLMQCREILYHILNSLLRNLIEDQPLSRYFWHIKAAVQHLQNNYAHDVPVDTLSSLCGLSSRQLTRYFQEVYAKSPHEYLIALRLSVAKDLLQNHSNSVTQIAEAVGYESVYSFSRIFKQYFGSSPTEWRHGSVY